MSRGGGERAARGRERSRGTLVVPGTGNALGRGTVWRNWLCACPECSATTRWLRNSCERFTGSRFKTRRPPSAARSTPSNHPALDASCEDALRRGHDERAALPAHPATRSLPLCTLHARSRSSKSAASGALSQRRRYRRRRHCPRLRRDRWRPPPLRRCRRRAGAGFRPSRMARPSKRCPRRHRTTWYRRAHPRV